jgi:hypothetical protein
MLLELRRQSCDAVEVVCVVVDYQQRLTAW